MFLLTRPSKNNVTLIIPRMFEFISDDIHELMRIQFCLITGDALY